MSRTQCVLGLVVLYVTLVHSWDVVVARFNVLEFYNEGTFVHMATPASLGIKWITYDPVHDRVLFTEKYNREDSASSFDIANQTTQSLIKKKTNRYLSRFAYDPATELLFGTVTKSIYSFPLTPGNNEVNGDVVITLETVPREVAVDSCGGHIYWTRSNIIERALFNGSEREVIIDNTSNVSLRQGLTVDSQKIYWIETQEYKDGVFSIESADLDGNNRRTVYSETESDSSPEKLTVSKDFIFWGNSIEKFFWQLPKNPSNERDVKPKKIAMNTTIFSGGLHDIAANYKIEERTQDVPNCNALKGLLPDYQFCFNSSVFCVHGTKAVGKFRCDCTQGYIGERCDVSVCENYCFQGNCSVSAEGQPQCRCNAGYSGVRCDVSACHKHCLNNGTCSLNAMGDPVCQCTGQYDGERCDVPIPKADGFHWVPLVGGKLPRCSVIGGYERGKKIYVARANYSGSLIPGKYVQEYNTAYFPWGGKEHVIEQFEILCGFNAKWVKTTYGNIPKNAIVGGRTGGPAEVDGEPLYICRDKIIGSQDIVCGKAYARYEKCYLPYSGQEKATTTYEILVKGNYASDGRFAWL